MTLFLYSFVISQVTLDEGTPVKGLTSVVMTSALIDTAKILDIACGLAMNGVGYQCTTAISETTVWEPIRLSSIKPMTMIDIDGPTICGIGSDGISCAPNVFRPAWILQTTPPELAGLVFQYIQVSQQNVCGLSDTGDLYCAKIGGAFRLMFSGIASFTISIDSICMVRTKYGRIICSKTFFVKPPQWIQLEGVGTKLKMKDTTLCLFNTDSKLSCSDINKESWTTGATSSDVADFSIHKYLEFFRCDGWIRHWICPK